MVVISASLCNNNGKILMARQFINIQRIKLEEYMANFPKLIESGNQFVLNLINLIPIGKIILNFSTCF